MLPLLFHYSKLSPKLLYGGFKQLLIPWYTGAGDLLVAAVLDGFSDLSGLARLEGKGRQDAHLKVTSWLLIVKFILVGEFFFFWKIIG